MPQNKGNKMDAEMLRNCIVVTPNEVARILRELSKAQVLSNQKASDHISTAVTYLWHISVRECLDFEVKDELAKINELN